MAKKFYLKDWHGKEKEFTDEKIFVRGEDGELIQFTQGECDKPAVVQPLEVTESGTYTAPDGVDGYSPVSVNVPTPEIKLQEKTITENGEYTADAGFDGLAKVLVNIAASGATTVLKKGIISLSTGEARTINHKLGVVPDIVVCFPTYVTSSSAKNTGKIFMMGASKAAYSLFGYSMCNVSFDGSRLTTDNSQFEKYAIDVTSNINYISGANEQTFSLPAHANGSDYLWIAIGGLT